MENAPPASAPARVRRFRRLANPWVLLALAVGLSWAAARWWATPRDPLYHGRHLSEWMNDKAHGSGVFLLKREDLKAMGPDAVTWLAWAEEHGHVPGRDPFEGKSFPFVGLLRRVRYHLFERKGYYNERIAALIVLQSMGPDAAPALPTLAKMVNETDKPHLFQVLLVLEAIGPPARPCLEKMVNDSDPTIRRRSQEALARMPK